VSKRQYPYAPDEFDAHAEAEVPVGVHRAPRSTWSKTWPFLAVIAVFATAAVVGVMLLARGGTPSADSTSSPTATVDTTDPAATDPAATDEPTDAATDGATDEPTDAATDQPTDEPTDGATDGVATDGIQSLVDASTLGAHIRVLNDGAAGGTAGAGRTALEGWGFTNVEATDQSGTGASANTVWYAAGFQDTAKAVAAILGIPEANIVQQTLRSGDVVAIATAAFDVTPAG
jgi:hypothetical protein